MKQHKHRWMSADTITDPMNVPWDWLKTDGKEMMENAVHYFQKQICFLRLLSLLKN